MDNFKNIIQFTLNYEKYWSDDPQDTGGLTIWGFASKFHPVEVAAMKDMSPEDAKKRAIELYYNLYWCVGGCNKLPDVSAQSHFESCVNPGLGAAIKFIQHAVGTTEDGVFGPHTKQLVDDYIVKYGDIEFAKTLIKLREEYYINKKSVRFGRGWANRCKDLKIFLKLV